MKVQTREIVAAIIAAVLVLTYCLAVLYDIVNKIPYNVPDAFLAIVVSVVSYFFGQHAATNGAYAAGATAAQAAASTLVATSATDTKPNP